MATNKKPPTKRAPRARAKTAGQRAHEKPAGKGAGPLPRKTSSARGGATDGRSASVKSSREVAAAAGSLSALATRAVSEGSAETDTGSAFPLEIDPLEIEGTLGKLKEQVVQWTNKGRYTKVRFKFRGKPLLPDLPLGAVLAAEGLTFYWGGILRALLFNIAGKSVLDVELINDSEKRLQKGKEELLAGELDKALACFNEALAMDRDNPTVHLNLGIVFKLKGNLSASKESLFRARDLDPEGPVGAEAVRILSTL